jgi:hypothetical protein
LNNHYLNEMIASFIYRNEAGKQVEIARIRFTKEGVLLEPEKNIVLWHDLNTYANPYYYSLFSKQEREYFISRKYTDWNFPIIYGISQGI